MSVKTIEEALAKCPDCNNGWHAAVRDQWDPGYLQGLSKCATCNGTKYACGVAPTEVERHLFAIVEATRALEQLPPLSERACAWTVLKRCSRAMAPPNHPRYNQAGPSTVSSAERLALSGREDT